MLKQFIAVTAVVMTASAGLRAGARQDERRQEPRPAQTADASQREQQVQARYNIFVMEGVLERAVAHGADQVRRQVRRLMPDMMLLSGEAQARGFRLDGYGVFFDVSVPGVRPSVAWSLRTMIRDDGMAASAALQQLKTAIERIIPDAGEKATLMQALKRLEVQVGVPVRSGAPVLVGPQVPAERGTVSALDTTPEQSEPVLTADERALLQDPHAAYEREVIAALKDAMLNHSGSIRVGPDEWLTVAAHDTEQRNRLVPGEQYDLLTIVLRVRGSDLAAFRADRITREEARKRVLVTEF